MREPLGRKFAWNQATLAAEWRCRERTCSPTKSDHGYSGTNRESPSSFPCQCEVRFHFQPLQPFGVEPGGGRTGVRAVAADVFFNANTGEHTIQSQEPLKPLEATV